MRKGPEVYLHVECPLGVTEKFSGRNLTPCISFFDSRGKEMSPNLSKVDIRFLGKTPRGTFGVIMNQNVPQIEDDGFYYWRTREEPR